jgi:[ribosomal protein S5]-alanine N-acetyltransferase
MFLKTERLLLREFVFDDWTAVHTYQSAPRYLHYYHWTERSEADVREFVQMFLDWQQERPRTKFQLAVVHQEDGCLIGNCGIRINDREKREANIGYELDSRYWGNGYATEAARAMLQFGFTELNMARIWAKCVADNVGSARVMQKIGMRLEARELKKEFIKNVWRDHLIFAIHIRNWIG